MVVVTGTLNTAKTSSLNNFDDFEYMAIGTSSSTPTVTDTTLGNEVLRELTTSRTKNTTNYTYEFNKTYGLSDATGNTIREVGIFNAISNGNLAIKESLPTAISKTNNEQLIIGIRVTVEATNV